MTIAFTNLGRFYATIDDFNRRQEELSRNIVRQFLFNIARAVVTKEWRYGPGTPVATGFAARSWRVGINDITPGPSSPEVDGLNTPPTDFTPILNAVMGDSVYLTSNCVYMLSLEFGHSQQAPEGMLRVVLDQSQTIMEETIRELTSGASL